MEKYRFHIGNILHGPQLAAKVQKSMVEGYIPVRENLLPSDNIHPGVVCVVMEYEPTPPGLWRAVYGGWVPQTKEGR